MTGELFQRYLDNRDASSFTYKTFNEKAQDIYPTFSICFQGKDIYLPYTTPISQRFVDIYPENYLQILQGEDFTVTKFNASLNRDVNIVYNIHDISYEDVKSFSVNFSQVLLGFQFYAKNPNQTIYNDETDIGIERAKKTNDILFDIGHQSANSICFTRRNSDKAGLIRKLDLLKLAIEDRGNFQKDFLAFIKKRDRLKRFTGSSLTDLQLKIFVHYPGHLYRSLSNPSFEAYFYGYTWEQKLDFTISSVTVLRKRSNSPKKCNAELVDVDGMVRRKIIQHLGCIPIYWLAFFPNSYLEQCKTTSEMKKAHDLIGHPKTVMNEIDSPCLDMKAVVTYNKNTNFDDPFNAVKDHKITFTYKEDEYQEIENIRAFGMEALWSGIGGFVGIFLGYSTMQLPDLVRYLSSLSQKVFDYKNLIKKEEK